MNNLFKNCENVFKVIHNNIHLFYQFPQIILVIYNFFIIFALWNYHIMLSIHKQNQFLKNNLPLNDS